MTHDPVPRDEPPVDTRPPLVLDHYDISVDARMRQAAMRLNAISAALLGAIIILAVHAALGR